MRHPVMPVISAFIVLSSVLIALCGCQKRRLYYPWELSARVHLAVDWSQCMERPSGMTLILYGDNGRTYTTVTSEVDGVDLDVMSGHYTALVFCYSVEEWASLRLSGLDTRGGALASLPLGPSSWRNTYGVADIVSSVPPSVISAVGDAGGFSIDDEQVDAWQDHLRRSGKQRWETIEGGTLDVLTLVPRDLVYGLEVRVRAERANNIKAVRAGIDGLAGAVTLADGRTAGDSVVQTIDDSWSMKGDATLATLTGRTRTLGLPGDATASLPDALRSPSTNTLDLHVLLRDLVTVIDTTVAVGHRWTVEPSENRAGEPATRLTMVLRIGFGDMGEDDRPMVIPETKPMETSSGFDAVVGEWEEGESIELPLW